MASAASTGLDSLPAKDAASFKSALKYYEHKQYKKGLKVCEQLVKKHSSHGESMALKGLFLGLLGRKEDGYENIRGGIKLCLKSPVCWHVYGLLCRADKNYDEAAKCYRNALRFDKDNGQILRDLAVLQLQMRQYSALCDTRYQLLTLRPVVKVNWINLAVAYHLSGKHEQAIGVLNAVLDAFPLESNFRANQLEQSELIFYKASILEESGKLQEAYDSLDSKLFAHPDVPTWYCRRAALLCAMERFNEAAPIYKLLLEYNPDCRIALQGHLQCSAKIDQKKSVYETISELQKAFPRSVLLKTELVNASDEKSLKNNLIDVILPLARRGILSAFSIIRRLYREEGLASILDDFCSELQQEILRNNKADYVAWIHLLLAQHYSFRPGEFKKAIEHMESAASLEPATPEVFLYYAKILRRLGHANEAAECMNFARQLDLSDRFLNSKTAKYMLKAGRIDEAKKLAGMFLKKSDTEDPLKDLVDMQVLWFAHEMGLAQQSFGDHVKAMTYFNQIRKHFEDFYEDQFDFHNYVLRRMTLCRYVKLLRYEDVISGHPKFIKTATAAIKSLIYLHENRHGLADSMNELSLNGGSKNTPNQTDYLGEANKWITSLLQSRSRDVLAHKLAFEVFIRQGCCLKAVRSLYQCANASPKVVISSAAFDLLKSMPGSGGSEFEAAQWIMQEISAKISTDTSEAHSPSQLKVPVLDGLLSKVGK